ncbi:hypothetical protein V6N12_061507 [Hibiscus sabdariffa]|uniref:Uncharacterized protein n=1 Tax=Hibiscus sabdariffa TaxID=183260 RepID=A0ABR2DX93_9ROSI
MSSLGTSKGVLEIAKFGLYVTIPMVLMYTFAKNTKNLQKFMGNLHMLGRRHCFVFVVLLRLRLRLIAISISDSEWILKRFAGQDPVTCVASRLFALSRGVVDSYKA